MLQKLDLAALTSATPGTFLNIPRDFSIKAAEERGRFRMEVAEHISVMCREATQKVSQWIDTQIIRKLDFRTANQTLALYIHGPQGVGKSHALALDVTVRRLTPTNRVIYLADCTSWGTGNVGEQYRFLLRAVMVAFSKDAPVVQLCREMWNIPDTESEMWHAHGNNLMAHFLPDYCKKNALQLLAVFDQHNGLTLQQREQMPFSMVEHLLPSRWDTALVIVSASANNSYYLKVRA